MFFGDKRRQEVSEDEIRTMVSDNEELDDEEKRMIHEVMDLGDATAEEVMTPRVDMIMVGSDETVRQAIDRMRGTGYSRLPVFRDDDDDIIGIVTSAVYGPANEHDISRAWELIPSETEQVYGDAGYVGMGKREEFQTDKEAEKRSYRINLRPGVLKGRSAEDLIRKIEHFKSGVRCKVEHVFARVKLQMSYRKTRYRGIAKNAHRINTMLALCNLFTFDCYLKRLTA